VEIVAYGRVSPTGGEIPLVTQKRACERWCESEEHAMRQWITDECESTKPLLQRDGFKEIVRWMTNNECDGVVVYSQDRISRNPGVVASFRPLTKVIFDDAKSIYTIEGEIDLSQSEDDHERYVGQAMASLTSTIEGWRQAHVEFRKKESLNQRIEELGFNPKTPPPWGLVTDKQKFDRDRVYEYVPDEHEEDNFRIAVEILNTFAYEDTTPHNEDVSPTAKEIVKEYPMSSSDVIRRMWDHRETYRDVVEKYREELTVLW
jgi:DNA invertase Pin-like site-specific DNA recombinase